MEYTGSMSELRHEILNNDEKWVEFIQTIQEADLEKKFTYNTLDGKSYTNIVADAVLHCINHSTFHRGQLITLLRQLGFTKLEPTDYIAYLR